MNKKSLALILTLVLVLTAAVGGTLAWLTDESEQVVNTFTGSDIEVTLTETERTYQMVPGYTLDKDPKATVETGSEYCYLFVKLEKSANFDSFLSYELATGWNELTGVDGVYYMEIDQDTEIGVPYSVLKDDQVTVKGTVTKSMMDGLTETTYPTLTVTAYASQLYKNNNATDNKFTPAEAWTNLGIAP